MLNVLVQTIIHTSNEWMNDARGNLSLAAFELVTWVNIVVSTKATRAGAAGMCTQNEVQDEMTNSTDGA